MPVGMNVCFLRDLRPQFSGERVREINESWSTLGATDYVRFEKIDSFSDSDLSQNTTDWRKISPGGKFRIVGVRNPLLEGDERGEAEKRLESFLSEHAKSGLVFIVQATISPVVFDSFTNFTPILKVVNEAESFFKRSIESQFPNCCTLWTLGGVDLLGVFSLVSESQIETCFQIVQELRETSIMNGVPTFNLVCEGHLFTRVFGTVAFSNDCNWVTDDKKNGQRKPKLNSLVTVASGHEKQVLDQVRGNLQNTKALMSPGQNSILIEFDSVQEFAQLHVKQMRNLDSTLSLDKSITDVFFEEPENVVTPIPEEALGKRLCQSINSESEEPENVATPIPEEALGKRLCQSINSEIDEFLTSLEKLLKSDIKCMGPAHLAQLKQIYSTTLHGAYRIERIALIRDLFPFFRTLFSLLAFEQEWACYLKMDHALETTSSDSSFLIEHIWRSIRNRMESLTDVSDPIFPNTIENGAGKLLNSYTVATWLCQELLGRHPISLPLTDANSLVGCDAQSFAVCVCAGSAGRVECREVFADFRSYIMNNGISKEVREQVGALGKVFLLSVSGDLLFRPEATLIHCVHEMAEFADWISQPWNQSLRFALNRHTSLLYDCLIQLHLENAPGTSINLLSKTIAAKNAESDQASLDLLKATGCLISITSSFLVYSQGKSIASDFELDFQLIQHQLNPVEYSSQIVDTLQNFGDIGFWKEFEKTRWGTPASAKKLSNDIRNFFSSANIRRSKAEAEDFAERGLEPTASVLTLLDQINLHSNLLEECVADFAILSLMKQLRTFFQSDPVATRLSDDVGYAFGSFIESVGAWISDHDLATIAIDRILLRWAIQHRAIKEQKHSDWIVSFSHSLRSHCQRIKATEERKKAIEAAIEKFFVSIRYYDSLCLFTDLVGKETNRSISSILRDCLWNDLPSGMVWMPNDEKDPSFTLLKDFLDCWNKAIDNDVGLDDSRSHLAFQLWAKGQKLMFTHVFVSSEEADKGSTVTGAA